MIDLTLEFEEVTDFEAETAQDPSNVATDSGVEGNVAAHGGAPRGRHPLFRSLLAVANMVDYVDPELQSLRVSHQIRMRDPGRAVRRPTGQKVVPGDQHVIRSLHVGKDSGGRLLFGQFSNLKGLSLLIQIMPASSSTFGDALSSKIEA